MKPGPSKAFDVAKALEKARDVFWLHGYDGASISDLEAGLGIGRKSLYDTFGNKRALFLRSLGQYCDSVIERICRSLDKPARSAFDNLERVLEKLQSHHGSPQSKGCLLGVAMAQLKPDDTELAGLLREYIQRLEDAFERAIAQAQQEGSIDATARARELAQHLVALTQGYALLGRIHDSTQQGPLARTALRALRKSARDS